MNRLTRAIVILLIVCVTVTYIPFGVYGTRSVAYGAEEGDEAPPSNGYEEKILEIESTFAFSNLEFLYLIFSNDNDNEDSDFNKLLSLDAGTILEAKLYWNMASNNNVKDPFRVFPLDSPFRTTKDPNGDFILNSESFIQNDITLSTRGLLGKNESRETEGSVELYSLDVTNDINSILNDGIIASIADDGRYGYALEIPQGMDINSFIKNGENIPKLVIRYMEETDEPPTEAELEAADKLLEARQESQSLLEGSGTVSDPYLIYDADDLQGMAENDNACYKLMNDIDLKGRDWRPPGYYYWYPFMGYLDGNGHTIKNLHVGGTSDDAWNTNAGGLFGYFEGRVENLHVETADSARKGVDFFGYAGGIAGVANAPAEIVNCSVNGYVSGNGAIGGLVGIAYPGVIIENCAAVGTVDMSDAFAYMNDNSYENMNEMVDVSYDILKYMVQIFASGVEYKSYIAEGKSQSRALFDTIWSKVSQFPIDSLMNTGTMQKMRRSYIGGLVGLNYGYIGNSYASVNIYNLQNYMTGVWDGLGGLFSGKAGENAEAGIDYNRISRTGGLVGLTIEDYGEIKNSYYDSYKIGTESNIGVKKTTDELKSQDLFKNTTSIMHNKNGEDMWDYTVSRKSTYGLPLPKCVPVVRNNEENGYIYYNSRVLMKTRPDFIIGSEVVAFGNDQYIYNDGWYKIIDGVANTRVEDSDIISKLNEGGDDVKATGAVYCTECDRLAAEAAEYAVGSDIREQLENQIAVTGRFQRGSDARPYHVHDLDSLLAMQDSKESHFILCNDIDFKIGSGDNTIQKYWWPAGKSHTSPIKGSLKGNVAYIGDNINKNGELQTEIYGDIMPHIVRSDRDRFTIKNLTVQSDRHVGLFACFRGTFSDINIELAGKDEWKSWRDGIKAGWKVDGKNMTAGLFTIRDKSSAGAVAGDTVNGAVIKNCIVTGGGSYTPIKKGIIKGGLRSGGIVGMNNRGCTIENCKSVVYIDACNYETIFYEDMFGTVLDIVKALISYADEIKDAIEGLLDTDFNKTKFKDKVDQFIAIAQAGKVGFMGEWGSIGQYVTDRWGNVCAGGLVGENFGKINDSKVSDTSVISAGDLLKFAGFILPHNHSMTVGRSNVTAEGTNVDVVREDQIFSYRENVTSNASSNGSVDPVADETDFAGGCGTADSPYEIKTIDQLARVRNYLKSGFHFRLENDLDFNNYRGNWVAIGTDADYFAFQGVFDGNGKTIKNLNMKSSAAAGLFGYCSGVIKNLKVENFHINTTGSSAGAIVAELCAGGRIEQCAVENSEIDSAHYSGGIAGAAYKGSLINNVYADKVSCSLSNILTPNTAEDTGLGGTSADSGFIFNNAFGDAYGIVSGMFDFVAGLPGFGNLLKGLDTGKSFVDGIFSGTSNFRTAAAGGVVGFLGGELSNSWVSRDTTLLQGMSGLAGGVLSAYEGDLVGRDFFGSIKGKNYVLATSTDRKDGIKEVGNNLKPDKFDGVIHLISGESNTDGYLRFPQKDGISLPSDIWEAKDENSKYKFELKPFISGRSCSPLTKEIIAKVPEIDNEDGYYMITDVNELAYVEYEGWSDYKLMNDIDLTGYRWAPLCREHDQYFDGTFDGQGYTIYGLNVETNENGGLFGYILGDVKNLNIGIEKVDAYGSAGGLAAGVFYPGNISKVSVVDNNIAIAMIGERVLRNRVNVDAHGSKSCDLSKCNKKEQEAFKAFLDVIVNDNRDNRIGLKSNYNDSEVDIMEPAIERFYEDHANKITPASEDKREKLYDGKIHINGGGNADGAGVGGLAGIVGKDVIIDNCYARVNVSNANFVMAKEMDLFGYSYDLVSDILKIISEFAGHLNTMMDDDINSDNLFESYSSYRSWLEGFESLDDINDAIRKLEEGEHKDVINRAKSDSGYGEAVKVGKGEVYIDLLISYDKYVDAITRNGEYETLYTGDINRNIVEDILKEQKNMNSAEKDGKTDYNFADSEKAYKEALTKLQEADKNYDNTGASFDTEKENYNKAQSELRKAEDERDKALKEAEKQFQSGSGKYGELMEKIEAYNAAVNVARAAKDKCDAACPEYEKAKASLSSQYNSYNVELKSFYEQADKYETSLKNEIIKTNDAIEKAKTRNNEIDTELAALEKKYEEDRNNADYLKKKTELNSEKTKNTEALGENNETLNNHIEQYKKMKLTNSETDVRREYIYFDKTQKETDIKLNDFDKENRIVLTEYCILKTEKQGFEQSQEEDYIAKKSDAEDNFIKRRNAFEAVYLIFDLVKGIADLGLKLHNDFYDSCVGGLIGESRGQLINCYSIGTVTSDFSDAKSDLWGLMDTLSLDAVNSGRLVGRVRNGDSGVGTGAIYSVNKFVSNCYYYGGYKEEATEKGEEVTYVHGEGLGNPCVELTRMKNQLTFDGFDFAKIWKMGDYSEYPELISADQKYLDSSKAKNNREFYFYGEGNGTAEDPYVIRDEEQFIQIATMRKSEYYYRLDTDLDLTTSEFVNTAEGMDDSTSFFGGLGYGEYERPFGDIYRNTADPEYDSDGFAGHFDGNGHKIIFKNQIVHEGREEGHYAGGLFPVLSGSVKNLEIVCKDNGESKARFNGTLAGRILDGAEVENVSVVYDGSNNAKINGRLAAGGFAGVIEKKAYIRNCSFEVKNNLNLQTEKNNKGILTAALKGTMEYVVYIPPATENALSDIEMVDEYNNTYCVQEVEQYMPTAEDAVFSEMDMPGFDFNKTWAVDQKTNKPALRCLNSTDSFTLEEYRQIIDEKSYEVNKKYILEYSEIAGSPFEYIKNLSGDEKNNAIDSEIEKLSANAEASIEGEGTSSDPFLISNAKDFDVINEVLMDGHTFSGTYLKQTGLIVVLKPFYRRTCFSGNYNGNGYTLSLNIINTRAKDDINADNQITADDQAWGGPLFYNLNGAVFRNLRVIVEQPGNFDRGFAQNANNTLILNCLFKSNAGSIGMFKLGQGLSAVNCIFENSYMIDTEGYEDCLNSIKQDLIDFATRTVDSASIKDKEAVLVPLISFIEDLDSAYPTPSAFVKGVNDNFACFNCDMVGLEDVGKAAFVNSYESMSNKDENAKNEFNKAKENIMKLKDMPKELYPHVIPWKDNTIDDKFSTSEENIVKFDLGDGIVVESVEKLVYTGNDKNQLDSVYQMDCLSDNTGAITGFNGVEAGTKFKINISYEGDNKDTDYVLITGLDSSGTTDICNLITAGTENEGMIGTLPADTEYFEYIVGATTDQTIHLYKQGAPYKAEIKDELCVGDDIDKVRFYYTNQIYQDVKASVLSIDGFDKYDSGHQNVCIRFMPNHGFNSENEFNIDVKLIPKATWVNAETMEIFTNPTKYYYSLDKNGGLTEDIDLSGLKITLNKGKPDEITRPIEELFALDNATGKKIQYVIVDKDGSENKSIESDIILKQIPSEQMIPGYVDITIVVCGKELSFEIKIK